LLSLPPTLSYTHFLSPSLFSSLSLSHHTFSHISIVSNLTYFICIYHTLDLSSSLSLSPYH
jgi:hypothetical protein